MINYILIIVGFAILMKGADFFVDSASKIAKRFGIPKIIIGLTIVSIGTSAPELAVSITSALKGSADIAAGNVIGSNILNLLVVIGVSALIKPIKINESIVKEDYPIMLGTGILLLAIISLTKLLTEANVTAIPRVGGVILITTVIIYTLRLIKQANKIIFSDDLLSETKTSEEDDKKSGNLIKEILIGIVGLVSVIWSGDLVVDNAVIVAKSLGMSDSLVGLTVIAIGTSLPELATSITAALKGESDMSVGNVVGSNIFNVLLILGATSTITPIVFSSKIVFDLMLYLIMALAVFIIIKKTKVVNKLLASSMILTYVGYTVMAIIRN